MTGQLEFGQKILAAQPFSVLVGAQLTRYDEGITEIRIPITANLMQQQGFVHGGVISYAADNALTFAGGRALGSSVVTSEFKINYIRPALEGELVARATVLHAGKSQAVCRCDVFTSSKQGERLCATAQGTISKMGQATQV